MRQRKEKYDSTLTVKKERLKEYCSQDGVFISGLGSTQHAEKKFSLLAKA